MGTKFRRSHVYLLSQAGNKVHLTQSMIASGWLLSVFMNFVHFQNYSEMALFSWLCNIDFYTKGDTREKIKYYRLSKNTEREKDTERESRKIGLLALENTS